ncbi:MAG: ankyrin repeat domain-containing protein, partial [Rickettsiales bacterium]|nr:ankyrin repeat domain-containing protein [Rickettsiales bacterium]
MPNLTKWLVKASSGYANIVDAAEKGNLEAVQRLIAAGYNVNRRRDKDGNTALLAALNGSHFEIVSYLLTLPEIDVNQSNNKGITPLFLAIEKENISIVSYLLTLPEIDVNQSNKKGITPLFLAIEEANFEIVKLLLLRDDIVVKKQVGWGYSPICLAVEKNLVEILKLLVNKPGADINEPGFKGDTPLILALNSHNILNWFMADADQSILRILLDAGADVNKEGYRNLCPMYYVIEKELNDVFELLIKCDINKLEINKLFVSGPTHFDTALTFAIKKRNLRLAESLISHDADQGITDNKGMTPLMLAINRDYTDFAVELIQKATTETINKKNDKGDTALTLAIEQGNLRLAESLISHDADQGIANAKGMTPLMLAIREGHYDLALKLIEKTTTETINMQNPDGDTALTFALK